MSIFWPFLKRQFLFRLKSFLSFHNIKKDIFSYDFCENADKKKFDISTKSIY